MGEKKGLYLLNSENFFIDNFFEIKNISHRAKHVAVINKLKLIAVPVVAENSEDTAGIVIIDIKEKKIIYKFKINNQSINNLEGVIYYFEENLSLVIYSLFWSNLFNSQGDIQEKDNVVANNNLLLQYKISNDGKNLKYLAQNKIEVNSLINNFFTIQNIYIDDFYF